MERTLKLKLLSYLLVSAISFSYFLLPESAGISVPVFILVQFAFLYFIVPKRKPLLMFIPIFILSLNSFISGNDIWRVSNFFVTIVLYGVMALLIIARFPIKEVSMRFIANILKILCTPFKFFSIPITWCAKADEKQTELIKRILIGVCISIPCLIFLIVLLSSADEIFQSGVVDIFDTIATLVNINVIFKILCGLAAGFYLFGLVYACYRPEAEKDHEVRTINGDLIILNILLTSIVAIYTIFVVIQFRYLFANSAVLPNGLTFTHYARRGFFELLFLSGLNIILILITVKLTHHKRDKWAKLTKALSCYLCVITMILLISSFYRMWLYNVDDGLTRLRFLVFGFLIFEAIGLIFTFFYIIKPKFNIVAVYLLIGLTYYLVLNVVPMDTIIAKDQIDRHFANQSSGINYTITLSTDAAPQIARLLESEDADAREAAYSYFEETENYITSFIPRWQRFNLSAEQFMALGSET